MGARVRVNQAAPNTITAKLKPPRRRSSAGVPSGRERSKKWKQCEPEPAAANGERRAAPFRKSTKAVKDRMERALSQRMYLIRSTELDGFETAGRKFELVGSTGNLYTVVIGQLVVCNCVDASKGGGNGHQCKHVLFVFLRVLGVSKDSHIVNQKALLQSELDEILQAPAPNNVAHAEAAARPIARRSLEDAPCPICFEDMAEHDACEATVWCTVRCGNNFHSECADKWREARVQAGEATLCPCCRSLWEEDNECARANSIQVPLSEGQDHRQSIQQLGLPTVRDASTYSEWFRNHANA